ncbi:SDR family oxidoreductase [Raoultella sp. HC6]|uniref:SDR family oxidoreductase n=1 Tax=Raoultella sp. HC6 TaxID=2923366 RepID=UPI001F50D713|nr:SDR family NAD(P)-dependent oxidoreductase [Raoultella sp. HC6]
MNLSGNTILITGGTSGIGLALARALLARGNTVLVTGRAEERLADARRSAPGLHTFVCDQNDPASIKRLCFVVTRDFPQVNILINNAGIGRRLDLNDTRGDLEDLEDLETEIRTNLIGPLQLIGQLLPHLKQQGSATIINVTSGLAFIPLPLKPIYCATKAAMHSYTQSLRVQLRQSNIKVIELAPPATRTNFNKGQEEMNTARLMDVDKLAQAALRDLERDREEILPGMAWLLRLIGRLNPRATLRRAEAEEMGRRARSLPSRPPQQPR